jgi:hypothetical protein
MDDDVFAFPILLVLLPLLLLMYGLCCVVLNLREERETERDKKI